MKNTIIKGSGNSRTLASVPNFLTLYPTYEAFGQALINGELPIDLGPLNAAGCEVVGDNLNKATLLKDTTAQLYGKSASAVPDDILAAIRPLITTAQNTANSAKSTATSAQNAANSSARVLTGSIASTGNVGNITFSVPSGWKWFHVHCVQPSSSLFGCDFFLIRGASYALFVSTLQTKIITAIQTDTTIKLNTTASYDNGEYFVIY